MPRLYTAREFAHKEGMGYHKVLSLIQNGRIPAAQLVGRTYIIPEDALIVPAHMEDFPKELLYLGDDMPDELTGGRRYDDVNPPPPYRRSGNRKPTETTRRVYLPSLRRLREERGWTRRKLADVSGAHYYTIERAEEGKPVHYKSLLRLAKALDVPYEELLRENIPEGGEEKEEE